MINQDKALTPQDVADILKITKNTVYELVKRGELSGYKVGNKLRVELRDVEIYKNKSRSKTGDEKNLVVEKANPAAFEYDNISYKQDSAHRGFVICGQDPMLDALTMYLQRQFKSINFLRSYLGSYNGLHALYQGEVDITSSHLWDGDTGEYNTPFVSRIIPGIPTVIIHLAERVQGFYVANGNPKNVKGWADLARNDITIVNKEKGSGTRILLDENLRKLGIPGSSINGYNRESTSQLAIISTIARGGADIGIGVKNTGYFEKEIDFIPLQIEQYDMVMKKEDIIKEPFQTILKILSSPEFQYEIKSIGGYDNIARMGEIVSDFK